MRFAPLVAALSVVGLVGLSIPGALRGQAHVGPLCRTGCTGSYHVYVTPKGAVVGNAPNSTGNTAGFDVANTGTAGDTYTLSCGATGGVTCVSVSPTSLSVSPGFDNPASVTYSVGATGGTLTLTASGTAEASDYGSYTIQLYGKPGLALRNHNGDNWDRSLCLTSGAGEAAAWECGDLVVTHGLPAYSTKGKARSLTLLYNSAQAVPRPVVAAAVNEGIVPAPSTVFVRLSLNGVPRDSATYNGWGATAPYVQQVAIMHDATSDSSGIYPFTLLARNQYTGGTYDTIVSDTLIVVNRALSQYGTGWSLVGVEELRIAQPGNKILWIAGDGSATVYRSAGTNVWIAAAGAYRDTLTYNTSTTTYTRVLRHRVQVQFDAGGRHIRTINRVGDTTTFNWTGSPLRLTSIVVPPGGNGTTYTLTYDGNGKLGRITDPASRVLGDTILSNRLTRIVDPDTAAYHTDFTYDGTGRMTGRTNRRGFTNSFIYTNGLRVDTVRVRLDTVASTYAVTAFRPWDEQGLAVGASGQMSIDTALVYTKIKGPQADVADTAEFWVDRWGAPTRIRSALGYETRLNRGDASNPALVTRVLDAAGAVALATYNGRGSVATLTDSTHQGSGASAAPALTTYTYADTNDLDAPSMISTPVDSTRISYDPSVHLPAQITAQGGHVTGFSYTTAGRYKGLLNSVTEYNVNVVDTTTWAKSPQNLTTSFAYDTLGNDTSLTTPLGARSRYVRDASTRVTSAYDPMNHRTDYAYTALNLVRQVQVFETYPSAMTLTTQYNYNAAGSVIRVVDPRGVKRSWGFDAANRPIQLTDDVGGQETRYFGPGGQLDSTRTRNGHIIRNTFDAAGRYTRTVYPASAVSPHSLIPGDSILRTYDALGRLLTATKSNGTVTYTYNPEGTIQTERQQVNGALDLTVRSWYDAGNRRVKFLNGTDTLFYIYGADGLLARLNVQWMAGGLPADSFKFFWDGLGRRDSLKYTYSTGVSYGYDADGRFRMLTSHNTIGDHGTLNFLEQQMRATSMNADGLVLNMTRYQGGSTLALGVLNATNDARHQLISSTGVPSSQIAHYDSSGNVIFKQINGVADSFAVVATSNHLATRFLNGTQDRAYNYDPNGNRIQDSVLGSQYTLMNRYYYNAVNQMVGDSETVLNGSVIQWIGSPNGCQYDAVGRRVAACAAMNTPWRGYDGDNTIIVQNSSGGWQWRIVHGPGLDDPLVAADALGSTKRYYYLTDGRGGQIAFTDSAGYDFSSSYDYTQNGGNQAGGIDRVQRFDNSRAESDWAPGLSFYRNRYYDQATGRWTQEDPLGIQAGSNLYSFSNNNPANFTDPFGLKVCFEGNDIGTLVKATEAATGTRISLDAHNCVSSFRSDGRKGFSELQALFGALVRSDQTYVIKIREPFGGEQDKWSANNSDFSVDGMSREVGIGRNHLRNADYPYLRILGVCLPFVRTSADLAALIAHELLGHASYFELHKRPSGEDWARQIQNVYHSNNDQRLRCGN